jgi:DNA excision repair protein ERCC-2
LKTMSKPFPARMQDGVSTWTYEDLMRNKGKIDAERQLDMHASGNGDGYQEHDDHAMADVQGADGMEVDAEFDAAMNDMNV